MTACDAIEALHFAPASAGVFLPEIFQGAIADAMEATADKKDPVTDSVDSSAEYARELKAAVIREPGNAKADAIVNKANNRDKAPE